MSNPRLVLKAVTLYGVGPYHDSYRLDIKPLTILCGANGTGKSTWIEMIRRLRNSLDAGCFPYSLAQEDSFEYKRDPNDPNDAVRRNATFRNALITNDKEHEQYYEDLRAPICSDIDPDAAFVGETVFRRMEPGFGWFGSVGLEIEAATDFTVVNSAPSPVTLKDSDPLPSRTYAQDCLQGGVVQKGMLFTLRFCLGREVEEWSGECDIIQAIEFSIDRTHSLFLECPTHDPSYYWCHLTPGLLPRPSGQTDRQCVGVLRHVYADNRNFLCHPAHRADEGIVASLVAGGIAILGEILKETTDSLFYLGPIRTDVLEEEHVDTCRQRYVGERGQHTMAAYDAYKYNEVQIRSSGQQSPFSPQFDWSQVNAPSCLHAIQKAKVLPGTNPLRRIIQRLDKAKIKSLVRRRRKLDEQEGPSRPRKDMRDGIEILNTIEEIQECGRILAAVRKEEKQAAFDKAHGVSRPLNEEQELAQDLAETFNELLMKRDLYAPGIWTDELCDIRRQLYEVLLKEYGPRETQSEDPVAVRILSGEDGEVVREIQPLAPFHWLDEKRAMCTLKMLSDPNNCYNGLPKRTKRLIEKGVDNLDDIELQSLNRALIEAAFWRANAVWHHPGFVLDAYFGAWLARLLGVVPFAWAARRGSDRDTPLMSDWQDAERMPAGVITHLSPSPEAVGYDFQHHLRSLMYEPDRGACISTDFSYLNNSQATARHFSTGFHQLAPIILQGGLALPGEIVAVQNPEAHLHPELQIGIAEYFVNEAKTGKVFVIETHSDLIIRRALRAILQEEISQYHVAIYFTEKVKAAKNATASSLRPIAVDAMGRISNWPKGFMDADIIEARRMMDAMYGALEEDIKAYYSDDEDNDDE